MQSLNAIIELASKGEIIFDHANKMIIQLNELQKVYQQIIETQKRPIFIPHEKDTTLSRENINRLLVTLRGYSPIHRLAPILLLLICLLGLAYLPMPLFGVLVTLNKLPYWLGRWYDNLEPIRKVEFN